MVKIREILSYKDMITSLIKRDLRGRYKGSVLGFLWNILNPLFQIVVYVIVFSQIMKNETPYYTVYLVVGIMPWIFFNDSLRQGSGCIVSQADMTKKIFFPREVLPLSAVLSRFVNLLITYVLVLTYVFGSGIGVDLYTLAFLPIPFLFLLTFSLGITLLFSAINVYFRDVEHILGIVLMAWMWITPIVYEVDMMKDTIAVAIINANPLTYFIGLFQQLLYYKTIPDAYTIMLCGLLSLGCLIIGEVVFHILSKKFAEEL